MDILNEAKRVFDSEINSLTKMRDSLDSTFIEILNEIVNCPGKIIITGMGKPGHVATKMAATFASLGTPAFYLHPAEAMHGDLGMISANDIVLAISYSGESDELVNIIPNIKLIGAKLIVLTGNEKSTLAEAADIVQVMPAIEEACYLGLAPTSSTTVEMCYGDALAVAASRLHDFAESDFGKFHPAGSLGKKIVLRVKDLMTAQDNEIPKVLQGTSLIDAIVEMSEKRMSIVSIVDEKNKLLGIMTDADLRMVIREHQDIYSLCVDLIMNRTPKVFYPNRLAIDAVKYMKDNHVNVMPIVKEGNILIGCLHIQQVIKAGIVI